MAQEALVGQGILIIETSRSLLKTHNTWQDSSGRVISLSQRPISDNTQDSKETDIHLPDGIRNHSLIKRTAADPRLRPRGLWDRLLPYRYYNKMVKYKER
jgi:hypothetical protein